MIKFSEMVKRFNNYSQSTNNPHNVTLAQINTMSKNDILALGAGYVNQIYMPITSINMNNIDYEGDVGSESFRIKAVKGIISGIQFEWVNTGSWVTPAFNVEPDVYTTGIKVDINTTTGELKIREYTNKEHINYATSVLNNPPLDLSFIPLFQLITAKNKIVRIKSYPVYNLYDGRMVSERSMGSGIPVSDSAGELKW